MENNYYKNRYGTIIKKCCASCVHKHLASDRIRICDAGEGQTKSHYLCTGWQVHPSLEKAGLGGGKIHKHEYNMYLLEEMIRRDELLNGLPLDKRREVQRTLPTMKEVGNKWEELFGSRFHNL